METKVLLSLVCKFDSTKILQKCEFEPFVNPGWRTKHCLTAILKGGNFPTLTFKMLVLINWHSSFLLSDFPATKPTLPYLPRTAASHCAFAGCECGWLSKCGEGTWARKGYTNSTLRAQWRRFPYIYRENQPSVGNYATHGSYGVLQFTT